MTDREDNPDPKEFEAAILARATGERARLLQEAKGKRMGRGAWLLFVVMGVAIIWYLVAVQATLHFPTFIALVGYVLYLDAVAAARMFRIERRLDALIRLLEERNVV